jgi:hypothetical protein
MASAKPPPDQAVSVNVEAFAGDLVSSISSTEARASAVERIKAFYMQQRERLQPWKEFVGGRPTIPTIMSEILNRVLSNMQRFQANYLLIAAVLTAYCLITSPTLLLALTATFFGAMFALARKRAGRGLKVFGHELTPRDISIVVSVVSLGLLYSSSAGSTLFWLLGVTVFISLGHAVIMGGRDLDALPTTTSAL